MSKERQKQLRRRWYLKNKRKAFAQAKAWSDRNPEKVRAIQRRYYKANRAAQSLRKKRWRDGNKEKVRAQNRERKRRNSASVKASIFKTRYGVSIDIFHKLFKKQKGLCAICRESAARHTDHDHASNKIRGLLCPPCNLALGLMKDSPKRLRRAAKYLLKTK